jgi:hypothetical protein
MPISIKLDASYPSMKGIQVHLSKGPNPHQKGDNHKNAKIGWSHLKIFSIKNHRARIAQIFMKAF